MRERSAYQLLFVKDFGSGPLFKNQGHLATELLDNQESTYYAPKTHPDYLKKLGNLKVLVSQLFSDNTRRTVNQDFRISLRALIKKKNIPITDDADILYAEIINDLVQKNSATKTETSKETEVNPFNEFLSNVANASYISIFSAREFRLEDGSKFVDSLMEGLIASLLEGTQNKWYRFNFPIQQLCFLFWMGARKELLKYIQKSKHHHTSWLVNTLNENGVTSLKMEDLKVDPSEHETRLVEDIVKYLSNNDIITVFLLPAPVYLVPTIALNPNDTQIAHTYCVFQSNTGTDRLNKLTKEEMILWNFFVWSNLRLSSLGTPVKYNDLPNIK